MLGDDQMAKRKEKMSECLDDQEMMAETEAGSMGDDSPQDPPTCVFSVDDEGFPMVTCPDVEAQQEAIQALEENPEVVVRVRTRVEELEA